MEKNLCSESVRRGKNTKMVRTKHWQTLTMLKLKSLILSSNNWCFGTACTACHLCPSMFLVHLHFEPSVDASSLRSDVITYTNFSLLGRGMSEFDVSGFSRFRSLSCIVFLQNIDWNQSWEGTGGHPRSRGYLLENERSRGTFMNELIL